MAASYVVAAEDAVMNSVILPDPSSIGPYSRSSGYVAPEPSAAKYGMEKVESASVASGSALRSGTPN